MHNSLLCHPPPPPDSWCPLCTDCSSHKILAGFLFPTLIACLYSRSNPRRTPPPGMEWVVIPLLLLLRCHCQSYRITAWERLSRSTTNRRHVIELKTQIEFNIRFIDLGFRLSKFVLRLLFQQKRAAHPVYCNMHWI